MSRPPDEQMIGRNVAGKFLVEKFIGGGAMGGVYKAYQKSIEKHVAIKVLHKDLVTEASFVTRFEREAKAASLLDHVNLMRVLDYGREPDGLCYIAMELLEGRSLFQVIKEDGLLANERIAGLVRQTLAGLAVAHDMGIIHRDLKPENIIVLEKSDDDGNRAELVKVCDFGMAKLVTPDDPGGAPLSSEKLTSHGVVVGTPDYMSPEQGRGEKLDARSDIYAVGVILYQLLTRQLPFSAETPIATLLRHVIDEPEPPSEIDPKVHPGLESICLRALAKKREDRFQTAREMRTEIRTVIEGRSAAMPSALPPPRLTLGSISDTDVDAFNLRAAPAPRAIELGPPRSMALTPPQSHRIRAVEVLREDAPTPRRWTAPALAVLLLVIVGVTFAGFQRRRASRTHAVVAAAAPHEATPSTPPSAATETAPEPASSAGAEPPRAGASSEPDTPLTNGPATKASVTRAIARAEASAAAAPSANVNAPMEPFSALAVPEVPKIAGETSTATAPPEPVSSAAAPAAATAFEHAKVTVGGVRADKVAASDVVAALPVGRFDRCYKKGLASKGTSIGGSGSLHLSIDAQGRVGNVAFAGAADLASVGQCVADAALGSVVKHVEAGATEADVDVSFKPE